ncbi:hypothetical protein L0935_23895, partial [Paracidovorax citrulli]
QDRDYYKEWWRERNRRPDRFAWLRRWVRRRRSVDVLTPWQRNGRAALGLLVVCMLLVLARRVVLAW